MKKLVHTVVGAAMVASLVAGCTSNEPAEKTSPEGTTLPVESAVPTETDTVPAETAGVNIEDTTEAPTDTTTIPEENTESEEETGSFTEPEMTVTTMPEEEESTAPEIFYCPGDCPNATDWA